MTIPHGRARLVHWVTFSNVPAGTVSFAIILQDLDVAMNGPDGILHWIAWNIPPRRAPFRKDRFPKAPLWEQQESAEEPTSDLPPDATRAQLLDAMKDIIVGKAAYVGRFRQ